DSIRNLPAASYYFFDDVSLIDITPNGVEEQFTVGSGQLVVYPNPASQSIVISHQYPKLNWEVNTIEVTNLLGQKQNIIVERLNTENCQLNTENLPSGIYFIKATDTKGNVKNGKFVKQ
ncbi:MAG: Secretion system C-terminal sorting domain, partial [Bacteroidota bacterium]